MSDASATGFDRSTHFMWIRDETGDTFRRPSTPQHPKPLLDTTLPLGGGAHLLQLFIQHPLYRPFRDPQVARAETLVEPSYPLIPQDILNRRPASSNNSRAALL